MFWTFAYLLAIPVGTAAGMAFAEKRLYSTEEVDNGNTHGSSDQ